MTLAEKAEAFGRLHHGSTPLLLPNAWDAASARLLESFGFRAIATSSAGVAAARGYADGEIPADEMIAAAAAIARSVDVPVSADVEDAYADLDRLASLVDALVAAGIVGVNVEDIRRGASGLVPLDEQVARIRAIRTAADRAGIPLVINARTDVYLHAIGEPAQREATTVSRLKAYRAAGADCLFVPGVTDAALIGRLVKSVEGPLNVLAVAASPPLATLQALGVARVSLGSGPMRVALAAFRDLLSGLQADGSFAALGRGMTYDEVNRLMTRRGR